MTTFYRVDGAKLSYAEYWRLAPDPFSFSIFAGRKLFGFPVRFKFAIPRPDSLFIVDFDELPRVVRHEMDPALRSAEKAGLRLIFCHRLAVPEPNRVGAAALLLDDDNETSLMIIYGQQGEHRQLQLACFTRFADDTLATTTTMKKTMEPLPDQDVERYPGSSAGLLYTRHREHLERLERQGLLPRPLDPDRLAEFVLSREVSYVDFHAARGVFVPMTEDELDEISGGDG